MMLGYKFLYVFLVLLQLICAEIIEKKIKQWSELVDFNPNKNNEYVFLLTSYITVDSNPGDFLGKYRKITIKGYESQRRILCVNKYPVIFGYSGDGELDFKLENVEVGRCEYPSIVMEGPKVNIEVEKTIFRNNFSSIQAISVKSLTIKESQFLSCDKSTTMPQIYVENKNNFRTNVIIENTTGVDNENDIKEVPFSGGWGYFSNSEIHFKKILSDGNTNTNIGAVFNIRNCTGDIRDSEFKNSVFSGKGVIYQYYSTIDIYDTKFHNNKGNGAGIYYVYGTSSDSDVNYPPSTLYRCTFENNSGEDTQKAAAINLDNAQNVIIYDSIFRNNTVISKGGCFQVNNFSSIKVINCSFEKIYALDSGGVFNSSNESHIEVKNCHFKDIYAGAGAIINSNTSNTFIIEDSVIEESSSGKALFYMAEYKTKTYCIFRNVTISHCIASDGLLYLYKNSYESSDVNFVVQDSKFINNGLKQDSISFGTNSATVANSAPMINIADVGQSTVTVENCDFIGNHVNIPSSIGGVLSVNLSRKKPLVFSNLNFINNTVATSSGNGGGL